MESFQRIHKWDNLKAILMFLVVVGHFANQFTSGDPMMKGISLYIYSFHMPLFIFTGGLFSRKWKPGQKFSWERPIYFILLGYLLKIAVFLTRYGFGKHPRFHPFSDTGIPWFMFGMAAFYILSYIVRKLDWRIVLPVSVTAACLAGYVDAIGSTFSLSRILVFFPFYYIGYLVTPEKMKEITDRHWLKWVSAAVLAAAVLFCVFYINDYYSYIRLFTARNPYSEINVAGCGALHRLACYVVSFIMSFAVIVLTPERENRLAGKIGARTLQIYFWHRLVLYAIIYSGFAKQLSVMMPGSSWEFVYLGIAVLLTVALVPDFFGIPLRAVKKVQNYVTRSIRKKISPASE